MLKARISILFFFFFFRQSLDLISSYDSENISMINRLTIGRENDRRRRGQ